MNDREEEAKMEKGAFPETEDILLRVLRSGSVVTSLHRARDGQYYCTLRVGNYRYSESAPALNEALWIVCRKAGLT